ncbi:hypothetical protein [Neobacillus massiliamazoniensis]|uniref:LPXTG cell wall anchor domain-containing protein n=1 Tax=Neobacillus massiliamazoniensis TaxID=1499688 RepID=A0A0U1NV81_9BACI|nr:hypothetical protein [Neobacillus massiliamazoniensis]CRK81934.1 hypothetical protein BN000_01852 [Neobacillus massiliamazoniensis]
MTRKISIFASLLFFLFCTNVFAHSYINSSSPSKIINKTDPITSNSNQTIALTTKKKADFPPFKAFVVPGAAVLFIIGLAGYWFVYRRRYR